MADGSSVSTAKLYGFCAVSTAIWSLFPVVITLGGGSSSAWLQVALVSVSYSGFFWVWLRRTDPRFATLQAAKIAANEIVSHKGLLLIQRASMPVYLLAAAYADPAVAAVCMETWILWYMLAEFRGSGIAAADRTRMAGLLALGLLGVAGVVYAQYGTVSLSGGWAAAAIVLACSCLQGTNLRSSLGHGKAVAAKLGSTNAVGGGVLVGGFVHLALRLGCFDGACVAGSERRNGLAADSQADGMVSADVDADSTVRFHRAEKTQPLSRSRPDRHKPGLSPLRASVSAGPLGCWSTDIPSACDGGRHIAHSRFGVPRWPAKLDRDSRSDVRRHSPRLSAMPSNKLAP